MSISANLYDKTKSARFRRTNGSAALKISNLHFIYSHSYIYFPYVYLGTLLYIFDFLKANLFRIISKMLLTFKIHKINQLKQFCIIKRILC